MAVLALRSQIHYFDSPLKTRQGIIMYKSQCSRPPDFHPRQKAVNDWIQNNDFVKTLLDANPFQFYCHRLKALFTVRASL